MGLGFHQQDLGFMSGLRAGMEGVMLLLVVFVVELSLISVHDAHGTRIFKDSEATCVFLMRLMIVSVVGLWKC